MKGEIPAIQGQTFEPYSETSSRSLSIPIKELGINHNLRRPRNDVLPILVTNSVNESTARERGIVVTTSSSEIWMRREAPAPHRPVSGLCSDYVACQSHALLRSEIIVLHQRERGLIAIKIVGSTIYELMVFIVEIRVFYRLYRHYV